MRENRISIILILFILSTYAELGMAEEPALDKLGSLQKDVVSFQVKYLINVKTKQSEYIRKGNIVFKENMGYAEEAFYHRNNKDRKDKIVMNFPQGTSLTYNYPKNSVYKIDYNSISRLGDFDPNFISFNILDLFMPFRYKALKDNSLKREGVEKDKDKDYDVISAVMVKRPFLGKRCKIWQAKDNNFIYKFFIYDEKDKPIFTLEVTDVEINPKIDDVEFSVEIPPDFKEIDLTEQFAQQYRILTELYNLYALNEELENVNKEIRESNEALKKKIDELQKGMAGLKTASKMEDSLAVGPLTQRRSILVVDYDLKFVIIGVGKTNDVEIGDIFGVYRENELLGKIQVYKIYEDMAVAEAITDGLMRKVKEGDKILVSTGGVSNAE
jgi:outer membrane lipoprotein-sorting protein